MSREEGREVGKGARVCVFPVGPRVSANRRTTTATRAENEERVSSLVIRNRRRNRQPGQVFLAGVTKGPPNLIAVGGGIGVYQFA